VTAPAPGTAASRPEIADDDAARARAHEILRRHGARAFSFPLLERGFRYLFVEEGFVAHVDTGATWVGGGEPIAPVERRPEAARAFFEAARAAGRRACIFGVGAAFAESSGLPRMRIGEQPFWDARRWPERLAASASLRYQLRRAEGKGVRARLVSPEQVADPDAPLRREVDALIAGWLDARPMAPMGFLVDVQPFDHAAERLYVVAEQEGRVVGFLAAVPIYRADGWLFEDVLRAPGAPNGTAELLVDAGMRRAAALERPHVTLGLAPLAGPVPRALRVIAALVRPLFDFRGLHAFKEKLGPDSWEPIYLVAAPGRSPWIALADSLDAFAKGDVLRFGLETLSRVPELILRGLTALLVLWIPLLTLADAARWFPTPLVKWSWVAFDVCLVVALVALERRWRDHLARALLAAIWVDAALTLAQALLWNAPRVGPAMDAIVLVIACAGPALGALALAAAIRRRQR